MYWIPEKGSNDCIVYRAVTGELCSRDVREVELDSYMQMFPGELTEVYDHHELDRTEAWIKSRPAIAYLKGVVKTLREELDSLKAEKAETRLGESEAQKMLLKAAFGNSAERREVKRELIWRGLGEKSHGGA